MKKKKSKQLYDEAKGMFPGGVHSPVRAFKSVKGTPLFIKSGNKCQIVDEDNNKYIDFCCSWGPLILGHNNKKIRKAITKTLANGTSFGAPTRMGNKIGKLLLDNHKYMDKVRFVSSGTEAVMSAVRLARGFTGKNKIIKFEGCYHGHVDSLLVKAGSGLATFGVSISAGIPESLVKETIVLPLDDLDIVSKTMRDHNDIAAVIIEPVPANNGLILQDKSYLEGLRRLCTDNNILLIFDEVISGFRVGFEGAAGYYDIQPDLITFGKIIGGGLPVGAFGGREDIMNHVAPLGNVYQAGTLSANPIAISAGIAALEQLIAKDFYEILNAKTEKFVKSINDHIKKKKYPMHLASIGSIFWIAFSQKQVKNASDIDPDSMIYFKEMHSQLLERGVYMGPSGYEVGFISEAHSKKDLKKASKIICKVLDQVMGH
jgi:glutamate-1-semialdehyde 2,1-aminomutase